MNSFRHWRSSCAMALILSISFPAVAQWAIGEPDGTAHVARDRYIFFVAGNPMPGQESAFNEWYQQQHMGDLLLLQGWTGAQRFRLIGEIGPRPTQKGYQFGYLILWDQEGEGAPPSRAMLTAAQTGGKIRKSPSFDIVTPNAILNMTYRLVGPKMRRADGKGPFLPAASDNTHVRPGRYISLEFSDLPVGVTDTDFEARLDRRNREVLSLPGWMAAQRMRFTPTEQPQGVQLVVMPQYLTVWEIEGASAKSANQILQEAERSGLVHTLQRNPDTAITTYWEPISPWVDKQDVVR